MSWIVLSATLLTPASPLPAQTRQLEKLDRGVVAIPDRAIGTALVSWRITREDPPHVAFNLYRQTGSGVPARLNAELLRNSTNWLDKTLVVTQPNRYFVRPVVDGNEGPPSKSYTLAAYNIRPYLSIPLKTDLPHGGYHAGIGDLDGDGEYDFVVRRGKDELDPAHNGRSTHTFKLEGYLRDGTFLWRVDLGWNIRAGTWYSPILVYDLDGDGIAEVVAKIGEVKEDLNRDNRTDYRDSKGRILSGPEYFVIIDGKTGKIKARENWIARGSVCDWGDCYGNRVNRNLLAVAYLDGVRPSLIVFRGTYGKMVTEAWNYRNGRTTRLWTWSEASRGGGFHNLRTGDIDGDGRDEIVNGSIAIDDDGRQMWRTGEGHGDRMHMTDLDPDRRGLELWYVQESGYQHPVHIRSARDGRLIWGTTGNWGDVGRGTAADIDPRFRGVECWASRGDLYSAQGIRIGARPRQVNMAIWWDGDLLRELLDYDRVSKWDWRHGTETRIYQASGNVGPRNAPAAYADVIGDWREEILYTYSNTELRIYSTTTPTDHRFTTLMHDSDYRISVACQTMGYMQATQPGFYLGRQPGKFNGVGCPKSNPIGLSYAGIADAGETLTLEVWNGAPNGAGFAIVGLNNRTPFPIDLAPLGLGGCFLYQSIDVLAPVGFDGHGAAKLALPIPNNTLLRNATLYNQAIGFDPRTQPGVRMSQAGWIPIGKLAQ